MSELKTMRPHAGIDLGKRARNRLVQIPSCGNRQKVRAADDRGQSERRRRGGKLLRHGITCDLCKTACRRTLLYISVRQIETTRSLGAVQDATRVSELPRFRFKRLQNGFADSSKASRGR